MSEFESLVPQINKVLDDHHATAELREGMTYDQAKATVWHPYGHSPEMVRAAAVFILGTLDASDEDVDQAGLWL